MINFCPSRLFQKALRICTSFLHSTRLLQLDAITLLESFIVGLSVKASLHPISLFRMLNAEATVTSCFPIDSRYAGTKVSKIR